MLSKKIFDVPAGYPRTKWSKQALRVLRERYLWKDNHGRVIETPEGMIYRVAEEIASSESKFGCGEKEREKLTKKFYKLMIKHYFLPNSPTLMNAGKGTNLQYSACFVLPIEDSMESIFTTLKSAALIHKSGGGTGFSFSRLRPKGSFVGTTGGVASGPISFMRIFDAATNEVKQGGCVSPETRISTEFGIVKIKSLGPKNKTLPNTWHPHNGRPFAVATDKGIRISDEFYNNGVARIKKITTSCGYSIATTLEHRLRVIDENGNYVWKYVKEIKPGDWVALQKDTYFIKDRYSLPKCNFKIHINAKKIKTPSIATPKLGEFIGFFIGDGAMSLNQRGTGRLIFTINDEDKDWQRYFFKIIKELFGLRPILQKKKEDKSTNYFLNSTVLTHWLKQIGVEKKSAAEADIPEIVFRGGRNFAFGFLRGLFSADGFVSDEGYISLSSVSEKLIANTQLLLLSLGIPSRIFLSKNRRGAFGKRPLYRLSIITKAGVEVFRKEIGFISGEKNKKLKDFKERAWEFKDIIPNQQRLFEEIYNGPGRGCGKNRSKKGANRGLYRDIQHYLPDISAPRNLMYSRLEYLAEKHSEIRNHSVVQWFLSNKQFYDRVTKIEYGESLTLDLSVPDNNTYIANGFVSHNTRRGANMGVLRVDHPDILEFIDCKNSGGITNFNISVAVTEEFMKAVLAGKDYWLRAGEGWPDGNGKRYKGGEKLKKLSARMVFQKIVESAWKTGDPGLLFIDKINHSSANPVPRMGPIEATNPCLVGSTLITTDRGLLRIQEAVEKKLPIRVLSNLGTNKDKNCKFEPIIGFWDRGKKQIWRLETNSGFELKATADHKVFTQSGWKALAKLKPGKDKVLIQMRQGRFNMDKKLPFQVKNEFVGSNGQNYKFNLPSEWSTKLGRVLGWLVGDGWLREDKKDSRVGFSFGQGDLRVEKLLRPVLNGWYGKNIKSIRRKNNVLYLSYHSKYFMNFFKKLGVKAARAGEKEVPNTIFTAPKEAVIGFLQGLFTADGTVGFCQKNSRLTSKSKKLLKQVQLILLNLGIFSRIYDRCRSSRKSFSYLDKSGDKKDYFNDGVCFELNISREGFEKFSEKIGFLKEKNKEKLVKAKRIKSYQEQFYDEVILVENTGKKDKVFDLTGGASHSFFAQGILTHNCGEQPLYPNEACNLGSINLAKMVKNGKIDWKKLAEVVKLSVRFLDDVIEVNPFPLPQIEKNVKLNRRIGLGVMGWADLLFKLGIPYDSQEAVTLAKKIMRFINKYGHRASQELAKTRGAFPNFKKSIYKDGPPMRNATVTTIAPTGSISILVGASSGIEPIFALAFTHKTEERILKFINPIFKQATVNYKNKKEILAWVRENGNLAGAKNVPEKLKKIFKTALEIDWQWHIKMQAAFQQYTDNAVSKTINMPNFITIDEVKKAYLMAYKSHCKGITVFRDGCKSEQVLNIGTKEKKEEKPIKERPTVVRGFTYRVETPVGTAFVTINHNGQTDHPLEVFINVGKVGSDIAADAEALGRLISLCLRISSPGLTARQVAELIVDQLEGIGGGSAVGFGKSRIRSLADGVAKVLKQHLMGEEEQQEVITVGEQQVLYRNLPSKEKERGKKLVKDICPKCGNASLIYEEGCFKCLVCDYSRC